MNITYYWEIEGLERQDTEDLVGQITKVFWKRIGEDINGNTGYHSDYVVLGPPSSSPIPFSDLTEELIIGWIDKYYQNSSTLEHVENIVKAQIEYLNKNGQVLYKENFPWKVNDSTPTTE